MVERYPWVEQFPGAITDCDAQGVILEMNEKAGEVFGEDGGRALIGHNVFDCHPEPARSKLRQLMAAQQANVYTIEKHGVKKLIYQTPWYRKGQYAGFVELSLEVPVAMAHFVRDKA